jgi:hypothetical protein
MPDVNQPQSQTPADALAGFSDNRTDNFNAHAKEQKRLRWLYVAIGLFLVAVTATAGLASVALRDIHVQTNGHEPSPAAPAQPQHGSLGQAKQVQG